MAKRSPNRDPSQKTSQQSGGRWWLALIPGLILLLGVVGGGAYLIWWIRSVDETGEPRTGPVKPTGTKLPTDGEVPDLADPDQAAQPLPAFLSDSDRLLVKSATVYLRVVQGNGAAGEGSGFFAAEPGLVITNAHVVGMMFPNAPPPRDITVILNSGEANQRAMRGKLLGVDRGADLAVVRVQAGGPLPQPLKLTSASRLHELQNVYVFGFPFGAQLGLNVTATEAKVSALRKGPLGQVETVQLHGDLHPGNSGGPVVNTRGQVVGVSVSIIPGTRIANAVPADEVKSLLDGRITST
ncbi:MAG: serine protease, partial [Gemmataceae bacterium]|nr:serine protease [Gemmataceae bacterium]